MLLALVVIWGSSFTFTRIGLDRASPLAIVAGRLVIGAIALTVVVYASRLRLPALGSIWLRFAALGAVGFALPFYLISWGQDGIDSGVAGILMAVMPLSTLLLAHVLVEGERITPQRATGFALGFAGVVVLTGPEAMLELGGSGSTIARQAAVLAGAICYAVNTILVRRLVSGHVLVTAAAVTIVASLMVVPGLLVSSEPWRPGDGSTSAVALAASIMWLGLMSTAVASIIYFRLIDTAGPTFLSLMNYLIPLVAVAAGIVVLGEEPHLRSLAALAVILTGLGLSEGSAALRSAGR